MRGKDKDGEVLKGGTGSFFLSRPSFFLTCGQLGTMLRNRGEGRDKLKHCFVLGKFPLSLSHVVTAVSPPPPSPLPPKAPILVSPFTSMVLPSLRPSTVERYRCALRDIIT